MLDDDKLLVGIEPRKPFKGLVKERERAKLAFEKETVSQSWQTLYDKTALTLQAWTVGNALASGSQTWKSQRQLDWSSQIDCHGGNHGVAFFGINLDSS